MDIGNVFPTTASALGTVAGAAAFCVLCTAWFKKFLADWRFTPLLSLGITFLGVELAGSLVVGEISLGERLFTGFLVALAGASLGVFGREGLLNLLGVAGVGSRSDRAIEAQAVAVIRNVEEKTGTPLLVYDKAAFKGLDVSRVTDVGPPEEEKPHPLVR